MDKDNSLLFFPDAPENDVQVMRLAAQALYGGADVFECLNTSRAILAEGGSEEAWRRNWEGLAESLLAPEPQGGGAPLSQASRYERLARASSYFRTAEFFAPFDSPDRKRLFDAARKSFRDSIPGLPVKVEVTAVKDGDVEYDGYIFHRQGDNGTPGPAALMLGGADSYAEELFFFGGLALAQRGITVLVADTPGRGSTIRHKGVVSRPDYEVPAKKALDHLIDLDSVDPERVGLVGVSLGGFYAPRLAAFDDRIKALVCWCGCLDVLTDIYEFCEPIRKQISWIVGADNDADARAALKDFNLRGVAENITCPTLITHGDADTIMDLAGAERLIEAIGAEEKHLQIYRSSEGGGVHCNYDNWTECVPFMFDWLVERLGGERS